MQVKLSCPNCGADIQTKDVNIQRLVAMCSQCNTAFSFEDRLTSTSTRERPDVLLPPGIEAYETAEEVDMVISWRQSGSSFLTFFTIVWNGFLIPFIVIAVTTGAWQMLLGISIHLLVGIGLLYNMIARFVNTTHVNVDRYRLLVDHRPLRMPFYKDRNISVSEIKQVFVEKYVSSKTNGRPNFAFRVSVALNSQRTVQLIRGLKHPDMAVYVEQQVERFLEIEDKPVEEEWRPEI